MWGRGFIGPSGRKVLEEGTASAAACTTTAGFQPAYAGRQNTPAKRHLKEGAMRQAGLMAQLPDAGLACLKPSAAAGLTSLVQM